MERTAMMLFEVRPGEGGKDSELFAQDLLKAFTKFAALQGIKY
jgi:protein subunit release factor A